MNLATPPTIRILIVDDNEDAAKTLVILRAWGLDADMSTNGHDALRLL